MTRVQHKITTSIGPLFVIASPEGLRGIHFTQQPLVLNPRLDQKTAAGKTAALVMRQLKEYFARKRTEFRLELDLIGTPFEVKVWRQIMKIPYGKTVSYQEIARKIGRPKAARAVGSAAGKNPFCVIVPCHRVIAADGSPGGYAGGRAAKKKLLAMERRQ